MNWGYKAALVLFCVAHLGAMRKNDVPPETKKLVSCLQKFPPDLWEYFWPFFSHLNQLPDNYDDVIMQTHARARDIAKLVQEYCNFDLASHKAANRNFLLASKAYVEEHSDEVDSFYLPNHISLACALGTRGARGALKEEIGGQMQIFRDLPQEQKNRLLIDVMRRCPSKIIIRKMLRNGAQVNARASLSHYTPLRFAVEEVRTVRKSNDNKGKEKKEEIRTVEKNRENKEKEKKRVRTKLVEFLLRKEADVDAVDNCFTTPLMRAASLGYEELVRLLAQKSRTINAMNRFGYSALYYAARTGNAASVRILLDRGARILFSDETQLKNVFVAAVEADSSEVLQLLLDVRDPAISVQTLTLFLSFALKRAVELGNMPIVQQLLAATESYRSHDGQLINLLPDFLHSDNTTALIAALQGENPEIAKLLIEFAKERYFKQLHDDARSLALAWAVYKSFDYQLAARDPEKAQRFRQITHSLLEDDNPNPLGRKFGPSACFFAARNQDLELLRRLLIYARARVEHCQEIALQEAIERSCPRAVHTVLCTEPNVNAYDEKEESIFFKTVATIKMESIQIAEYLLAAGADASKGNITNETPVHAVMANPNANARVYILDELHRRNIVLNKPDNSGNTPLHLACSKRPFMNETAELLLEYGADPNVQNQDGDTPLIHASDLGNEELVRILLKRRADPNIKNRSGCGALTKAARVGSMKLIEMLVAAEGRIEDFQDPMLRQAAKGNNLVLMKELIEHGANINSESTSLGNTPLHKAVNNLCPEAVQLLLERGANARARNRKGETPLELAMTAGDPKVLQLLLDHKN